MQETKPTTSVIRQAFHVLSREQTMQKQERWNQVLKLCSSLLPTLLMFVLMMPLPCCGGSILTVPSCGGYTPPQCLALSSRTLDFGTIERGNSKTMQEVLRNTCSQVLNWSVDIVGTHWLSVSRSSGSLSHGDQQAIQVRVNTAGLASGKYQDFFNISLQGPPYSIYDVTILLTVQ